MPESPTTPEILGTPAPHGGPGPAVLFPDWQGRPLTLCRALYGTFPVFRAAFDTVCRALDDVLPLPLAAVVFAPQDGVDTRLSAVPQYGRGALLAYQVALYRLWEGQGVRGAALAGDGVGACAAGHVAGTLTLRAAAHGTVRPAEAAPPRAEHRLRSAGHTHVLECGPHPRAGDVTATVGDTADVLTALTRLHRPIPLGGLAPAPRPGR
ncbi:acyltransferase domain-containing protein [Streptomyces sp. NPDC089424]|uniref:acyltransferase domain-containing protein n=1 Tax=Streptomyces sp. NPDC089424 TaxID=3365917 RepID=UPI00380C1544